MRGSRTVSLICKGSRANLPRLGAAIHGSASGHTAQRLFRCASYATRMTTTARVPLVTARGAGWGSSANLVRGFPFPATRGCAIRAAPQRPPPAVLSGYGCSSFPCPDRVMMVGAHDGRGGVVSGL